MTTYIYYSDELYHHGVKGQKHGERRYQNKDGSYTALGQAENNGRGRYSTSGNSTSKTYRKVQRTVRETTKNIDKEKVSKALKIGGAIALAATATAAAVYVSKHPEVAKIVKDKISSVSEKTVSNENIQKGKSITENLVKEIMDKGLEGMTPEVILEKIKQGAIDGVKQAPYEVAKTFAEGAGIIATTKALEKLIGKENTNKIINAYNAYHKKNKVGKVLEKNNEKEKDEEDNE